MAYSLCEKEDVLFCKRMNEFIQRAITKEIPIGTNFLSLYEQSICAECCKQESEVIVDFFGGYPEAERRMACFRYKDSPIKAAFSIACIEVTAAYPKFSENLTHRDYLGALMNLGLERNQMGDILLGETHTYLFCIEDKAPYICDNLSTIKHTQVKCKVHWPDSFDTVVHTQIVEGTISSERLDSILAVATKNSRSRCVNLITEGKVFIDGRLIQNVSHIPKQGDYISIRGFGRFQYMGFKASTKKERLRIQIIKYI